MASSPPKLPLDPAIARLVQAVESLLTGIPEAHHRPSLERLRASLAGFQAEAPPLSPEVVKGEALAAKATLAALLESEEVRSLLDELPELSSQMAEDRDFLEGRGVQLAAAWDRGDGEEVDRLVAELDAASPARAREVEATEARWREDARSAIAASMKRAGIDVDP